MTIQTIILSLAISVALFAGLFVLTKKANQRLEQAKKWYYDKLAHVPFFVFNITTVAIRHNGTMVYLNNFVPLRTVFKDLQSGDFSESQYILIRDNGAASYNTEAAALAAYKSFQHLGLAEVTADKAGRFTVRSIPLPGYEQSVEVELGYNAFKELTPPDFSKIIRESTKL